jgi:hypothetical protein
MRDPRQKVLIGVLNDLQALIQGVNYHISLASIPIETLVELTQQPVNNAKIRFAAFNLLLALIKVFENEIWETNPNVKARFFTLCESALYDSNTRISFVAAKNLALLAEPSQKLHLVSSLCVVVSQACQSSDLQRVESLLQFLVKLVKDDRASSSVVFHQLVGLLGTQKLEHKLQILRAMNLILSKSSNRSEMLLPHLDLLVQHLTDEANQKLPSVSDKVASCLFKACQSGTNEEQQVVLQAIQAIDKKFSGSQRGWERFLIARSAACHGFHFVSSDIFLELSEQVESVPLHYWLKSLGLFSSTEHWISSNKLQQPLTTGVTMLLDSLTLLKAAKLKTVEFTFQEKYLTLRQQFLLAVVGLLADLPILLATKNMSCCPSVETFHNVAEEYHLLRCSFFDLDQSSIELLELNQIVCCLLIFATQVFLRKQE